MGTIAVPVTVALLVASSFTPELVLAKGVMLSVLVAAAVITCLSERSIEAHRT